MIYLLIFLLFLGCFYGGVVFGIADCKRSYGIGKHVTPDGFNSYIKTLQERAYDPYQTYNDSTFDEVE